jgi:hypothetical protein
MNGREDAAIHAEVGMAHVGAFDGLLEAEGNAAEVGGARHTVRRELSHGFVASFRPEE